jgi:uncharacterized membrane protein
MPDVPHIIAWSFPLRLEYLGWPQTLGLFALLSLPIIWLAIRSLAGLGPVRRWVALGVRLMVLLLFVLLIAGARWQRQNTVVEVLVLRDISQSTAQVHDYPGPTLQASLDEWLRSVADNSNARHTMKRPEDRIGVISFHDNALIDAMPNTQLLLDARAVRDPGAGTDVSSAVQLGLATMGKDAMHRMVLIWDGNQTMGDVDTAIAAAAAQNVPIDMVPLTYDVQNEVLVERFVAPSLKRENEPFTLDVILRSTNTLSVTGKLTVLHQNQPMDLDPYAAGIQATRAVTLKPGLNVERVRVPALKGSGVIHQFRASFEADQTSAAGVTAEVAASKPGDTLLANNAAEAFTFVRGKGRILYVDNVAEGRGRVLADALRQEGIDLESIGVDQFPNDVVRLQNYDAVVLNNVPRGSGGLSEDQQQMLATYVHDVGGGLVMVGGPDTFGAGGWQGSRLEEVLPVRMEIPAQRQLPKGALVMIMHSCEMPNGNYWGEQCALKAVQTLSEKDEIGVISYGWGAGGSQWDYELSPKGDGSKVNAAIKRMKVGDMPDFDSSLDLALNGTNGVGGLLRSDARQKHVIIISDGDPSAPQPKLVQQYLQAQVSVSTVAVYPHDVSDRGLPPTMRMVADSLKGRAYGPIDQNPNQLPQIFIKEATVVRRTLIQEDRKGMPVAAHATSSELIKGLEGLEFPPVYGIVLTSRKENPQIEYPLSIGKQADPLFAHWQTGLGRAAAFTSDAHGNWGARWVAAPWFSKFWAQVVRGVARPPISADFDVQTSQEGAKGRISVEAINKDNTFLSFLSVRGTVIGPDGQPREVRLVQTGPGAYVGEFEAREPGSYVAVLSSRGINGQEAMLPPAGIAVNASPELRDLHSNEAAIRKIADATGGRVLEPFDLQSASLFSREGLLPTASPLPIWDVLLPILLGLILVDVATRRIAWDWLATKKAAASAVVFVRSFTTTRRIETRASLDALRKVRDEAAEGRARDAAEPVAGAAAETLVDRVDRTRKFQADQDQAVEGDISKVVGGATDKPVPSAAPKGVPKGLQPETQESGGHTSSLLEAKRRARQQMQQREKDARK